MLELLNVKVPTFDNVPVPFMVVEPVTVVVALLWLVKVAPVIVIVPPEIAFEAEAPKLLF